MTVTVALGLRFIWIDSLCIIQDDENDKAIEISRMPEVYELAWVTISASSAWGCSDGFLTDRTTIDKYTCAVQYRCRNGRLGSVLLVPQDSPRADPLDSRAWALQERLLSPRLIEFASH